jgi:hypothetical protein
VILEKNKIPVSSGVAVTLLHQVTLFNDVLNLRGTILKTMEIQKRTITGSRKA